MLWPALPGVGKAPDSANLFGYPADAHSAASESLYGCVNPQPQTMPSSPDTR